MGLGLDFCTYLLEHTNAVERSGMRNGAFLSVKALAGDQGMPKIPALLAERALRPAPSI